jgi:hypothetical protein
MIKKVINNEGKLFVDFMKEVKDFELTTLEKIDAKRFYDYEDRINSEEFKTLSNFIKKYDQNNFDYNVYLKYLNYLDFDNKYCSLLKLDSADIVKDIDKNMDKKPLSNLNYIYQRTYSNIKKRIQELLDLKVEYADLKVAAESKRRRKISDSIVRFERVLKLCFPVIISNPDTAAMLFRD